MHAKVKGTKETVTGLGSGKQGGLLHLAVIIGLNSVSIFLFSFLNEVG